MSSIPTLERLQAELGRTCFLSGPWAGELPAELVHASEGVAMNRRYRCYHAEFALPEGLRLGQVVCSVRSGTDTWPGLLLTPAAPEPGDARQRLHTVFHYEITQASAATTASA